MSLDLALVRGIEERAFNAWPALQTLVADGWLLRFADGFTKRANSINAWAPIVPVDVIVTHAAPIYAGRRLPLVVRLSPLADLDADAVLASRGLARCDETIVMIVPLSELTDAPPDPTVVVSPEPGDAWLAGFAAANGVPGARRAVHDRMLALIPQPAAFSQLMVGGQAVAWGLAVVERGMVGLFDIVTAPQSRRQGAGRRLVSALLAWGARNGASTAYLQVVAANAPALELYERLGFREAYRYHYRIGELQQP
ncbi:MAG: GNAT family N-acetyltransferase [Hyphomicrobiaceae bacterium]|nr:GNAT family N-acetyltransferase [Hyphomicrobiaceae bacterium]